MISKSGQSAQRLRPCIPDFDPDRSDRPAVAVHLDFSDYEAEVPQHQHRQGQLILALHGAVTCTAANGLWIVPPDCGVWIPGGVPHSNRVTSNARLSYLFVEPGAAALPLECCTLSVSPMLREMILRLADVPGSYGPDDHVGRLARVLLDELALMPKQGLELPVSSHPKIAMIAAALTAEPSDRRTLGEWGCPRRHERAILEATDGSGNRAELWPVAAAIAPGDRAARTRQRRDGPEGVERPGVRVCHRLHRDVQERARDNTNALLLNLTGRVATWAKRITTRNRQM